MGGGGGGGDKIKALKMTSQRAFLFSFFQRFF